MIKKLPKVCVEVAAYTVNYSSLINTILAPLSVEECQTTQRNLSQDPVNNLISTFTTPTTTTTTTTTTTATTFATIVVVYY